MSTTTTIPSTMTEALVPRLVTTAELALVLGVSVRTVRRMRDDSQIPAIKVRSVWRFDVVEVLAELRRHTEVELTVPSGAHRSLPPR